MVLLIDEVDRADEEFEAFLLEILSDFQITIPEMGTVKATHKPLVIITSNRVRELHDALKRRCLYHFIDYPTPERELEIILAKMPDIAATLAQKVSRKSWQRCATRSSTSGRVLQKPLTGLRRLTILEKEEIDEEPHGFDLRAACSNSRRT